MSTEASYEKERMLAIVRQHTKRSDVTDEKSLKDLGVPNQTDANALAEKFRQDLGKRIQFSKFVTIHGLALMLEEAPHEAHVC